MSSAQLSKFVNEINNAHVRNDDELREFGNALLSRVDSTAGDGTEAGAAWLSSLGLLLTAMYDDRDVAEAPFFRIDLIEAIDEAMLRDLVHVAGEIESAPARARVVEAAWHRRLCAHDGVQIGVRAHIEHARQTIDPKNWPECFHALQRAARLGAALGKGQPLHVEALDVAAQLVRKVGPTDSLFFCCKTMDLLLVHRYPAKPEFATLAAAISKSARQANDFWRARSLTEVEIRWHQRSKNEAAATGAKRRLAELIGAHAEHHAVTGDTLVAVAHQTQAVEAWRKVGGAREETRTAQVRLQELQRESVDSFCKVEFPLDLSACAAQAKSLVSGQQPFEAIFSLITFQGPTSKHELIAMAKARLEHSVLARLLPWATVSPSGRRLHQRPGLLKSNGDESSEAHVELRILQQNLALGAIAPAAEQIQLEHGLTTGSLLALTANSVFVPPGRAYTFARGLALGFQGEFQLAVSLLVPQFENALRYALEQRGALVSTLPAAGGQNEIPLNALLDLPEALTYLGDDEIFELQSLLVSKAGSNLRNNLAHGLIDDGQALALFVYVWWKVLQYVVLRVPGTPPPDRDDATEATETG